MLKDDFDWEFYTQNYIDLRHMKEDEALRHYQKWGIRENRLPSKEYFYKLFSDFNWVHYIQKYEDLSSLNETQAMIHYYTHGSREGRVYKTIQFNILEPFFYSEFSSTSHDGSILFNIIIRTSDRPYFFQEVLLSVRLQTYSLIKIIVICDNLSSKEYVLNSGLLTDKDCVLLVNPLKDNLKEKGRCFYNLYFYEAYQLIEDGWILHLDDDNMFTTNRSLEKIYKKIQSISPSDQNKFLTWNHNLIDKVIPLCSEIRQYDVDTNMFIFPAKYKDRIQWDATSVADFNVIFHLATFLDRERIEATLTSNNLDGMGKIRGYGMKTDKYIFRSYDINRIDFVNYRQTYSDFPKTLRLDQHWETHGKKEGRVVKLTSVDYEKVEEYFSSLLKEDSINEEIKTERFIPDEDRFDLIISLYEEPFLDREKEYLICLRHNLQNPFLRAIHIFFEGTGPLSKEILSWSSPQLIYHSIKERPSFENLFSYANRQTPQKWIIVNADIVFDLTLKILNRIDLKDKLLALTRWDLLNETTPQLRHRGDHVFSTSQDTWIFQTPFRYPNLEGMKLGQWNCDGFLNYKFRSEGFPIYNPCFEIRTIHLHFSGVRRENQNQEISRSLSLQPIYLAQIGLFEIKLPRNILNGEGEINLLVQYYSDSNRERRNEFLICLWRNLDNACVRSLHCFMEPETILPPDIVNHPKLVLVPIDPERTLITTEISPYLDDTLLDAAKESGIDLKNSRQFEGQLRHRLTYGYAFDYANQTFSSSQIVAIANGDIIIEEDANWMKIRQNFFERGFSKKVLILSRHEIDSNDNIFLNFNVMKGWSNDVWCFQTPVELNNIDFCVGNCPTCDNALIERFYQAGYHIYNWAFKYRIFHLDRLKSMLLKISLKTDLSYPAGKDCCHSRFVCPWLDYDTYLKEKKDPSLSVDQWRHSVCLQVFGYHPH